MNRRAFYADLAERSAWTFVQAFAAVWLVTGDFDGTTLKAAAVAGAIAVVKGLAASQVGTHGSASTLPESLDP